MRYEIMQHEDFEQLAALVNLAIAKGFKPLGGVAATHIVIGGNGYARIAYVQALISEEEPDNARS